MFRLQKKKNQNYFPQGCELERIKPNLGTLSALSAPHDKINFCSQHISAGGDAGSVVPATPHVPGHGLCWRGGGVPSTHPAFARASFHLSNPNPHHLQVLPNLFFKKSMNLFIFGCAASSLLLIGFL